MHKFKNLDGLRGLAALIVIFGHYANAFYPAITGPSDAVHSRFDVLISGTPAFLVFAASFSVSVFFVLSGFVLSVSFFRSSSSRSLTQSAIKRYFRLMLPALVSILIAYGLLKIGAFRNLEVAHITGSTGWLARFWNFPADLGQALYEGLYGIFFTGANSYNTSLWTMQVELFGSFLLFMILALFGRLTYRWVFYLAFIAIFFDTAYPSFILGIMICDIYYTQPAMFYRLRNRVVIPLFVLALWLGSWILIEGRPNIYNSINVWGLSPAQLTAQAHTIGAGLIVFTVMRLKWLVKLFESRPLQYLGSISFSMYLIHLSIIGSFSSYLFRHLLVDFNYNTSFMIMFVVSLTLLFLLSSIFLALVDRPSTALSRRLSNKLDVETIAKEQRSE